MSPKVKWFAVYQICFTVLVDKLASAGLTGHSEFGITDSSVNPHATRIAREHDYCIAPKPINTRQLPSRLLRYVDEEAASDKAREASTDSVFNYGSAVLNDGLLMLNLRDAIHEGGLRIKCCWKFMLLYWWHAGHPKYVHEAVQLICALEAAASPRIARELLWCRTVNPRGISRTPEPNTKGLPSWNWAQHFKQYSRTS